jgi:hypothetical protein
MARIFGAGIDFGIDGDLHCVSSAHFAFVCQRRGFNIRFRAAAGCSLAPGAATILHNHAGKDVRESKSGLRQKKIPPAVRYTHIGYKQTRQTAEALTQALEPSRSVFSESDCGFVQRARHLL